MGPGFALLSFVVVTLTWGIIFLIIFFRSEAHEAKEENQLLKKQVLELKAYILDLEGENFRLKALNLEYNIDDRRRI